MKSNLIVFIVLMLVLGGCGSNSKDSSSSGGSVPTVTYTMTNGYCYASTGQIVSNSYCTGQTNGCYPNQGYMGQPGYMGQQGYMGQNYPNNGFCNPTAGGVGPCMGYYYFMGVYGYQMVYCNGLNCSGYTLYNATTYQMQTCQ